MASTRFDVIDIPHSPRDVRHMRVGASEQADPSGDGEATEVSTNHFDNDVFISYAHIDNCSLVEGEPGWITQLRKMLQVRLTQLRGKRARVWLDPELRKSENFHEAIRQACRSTKAFLSVLTPGYLESAYCRQELEEFVGLPPEPYPQRRLFKVIKTPVPLDRHPDPMRNALGFEFYGDAGDTGPREWTVSSPVYRQPFLDRLEDLATELAEVLALLETPDIEPTGNARTIYLASTTSDVRDVRDGLARQLSQRGYRVVPRHGLPLDLAELTAACQAELDEADLAVHVVGHRYGVVPESSGGAAPRSVMQIENDLAAERARTHGLRRVIWLPKTASDGAGIDDRQQEFVDALRRDPASQANAHLIIGTLEDLTAAALARIDELDRVEQAAPDPAAGDPEAALRDAPRVYLVHAANDDPEAIDAIEDAIEDRGCDVWRPDLGPEVSAKQQREDHEYYLANCDACMIYYGRAREVWVNKQLDDVARSKRLRDSDTTPLRYRAVYIADAGNDRRKQRFKTNWADETIRELGGFAPELLESMLHKLEVP